MDGIDFAIEATWLTDVGRKRDHNEDYVLGYEPANLDVLKADGRLYIVADGVGGEAAGEVASEYAVKKLLHDYYQSQEADLGERLQVALINANADLFSYTEDHPEVGRMGTTLVVAAIRGQELVIANVGDSRAYLLREDEIRQITQDHSLVARLVAEGELSPEEAAAHPRRNVLLRCLGMEAEVYPDIFQGIVCPDDRLVLCSDGLTNYLSIVELGEIVSAPPLDAAARRLVQLANARGGKDNISVLLLHITEVDFESTDSAARTSDIPAAPEFDIITDVARQRQTHAPHLPRWRCWLRQNLKRLLR